MAIPPLIAQMRSSRTDTRRVIGAMRWTIVQWARLDLMRFVHDTDSTTPKRMSMVAKLVMLGCGGFIGSHLLDFLLPTGD